MAYIESVHSSDDADATSNSSNSERGSFTDVRRKPGEASASNVGGASASAPVATSSGDGMATRQDAFRTRATTSRSKPTKTSTSYTDKHPHWADQQDQQTDPMNIPRSSSPTEDPSADIPGEAAQIQEPSKAVDPSQAAKHASFRARARRFSSLSSRSTTSTNATADSLPGPGRTVGRAMRWMGRKVEGWLGRMKGTGGGGIENGSDERVVARKAKEGEGERAR